MSQPIETEGTNPNYAGSVAATAATAGAAKPRLLDHWAVLALNSFFSEKIVKWGFFSVAMALIPLVASALNQGSSGANPSINEIVGKGELLLIASALCARSCGELFGSGKASSRFKIAVGASSLFILVLSAMQFSHVATSLRAKASLNIDRVTSDSLTLYACAVVTGLMCVWLSER